MERYKITWTPSPSTFVQSRKFLWTLDGGAEHENDLQAFDTFIDVDVPTGSVVVCRTRVIGDNGKTAENTPLTFTATNEEPVQPDGPLTATWIAHIP